MSERMYFNCVAFDDSGRFLVGSSHSEIRVWDITEGAIGPKVVLVGHHGDVPTLATSSVGARQSLLASGGNDGNVIVWNLPTFGQQFRLEAFQTQVDALAFTPSGRHLIVGTAYDGPNLFLVDMEGKRSGAQEIPGGVRSLAVDPQGVSFAVGTKTGAIEVRVTGEATYAVSLEGHTSAVTDLAFTKDGRILVSRSLEHIRVWDADSWEPLLVLDAPSASVIPSGRAALNPESERLVTVNEDGHMAIWDLDLQIARDKPVVRGAVRYITKKVALVGDSGVGKTSLGYRMANGVFEPQESTHGQQFWTLKEISSPSERGSRTEVILWDFAGQPEYRIVHSLFLENIDCALILLDAAHQEDPLRGLEYWLQQLAGSGGSLPPAVLVGARSDRGVPAVTREDLDSFCQDRGIIGGYCETSAKTGEGISSLLETIKVLVEKSRSPLTISSQAFHAIKSHVLEIKSRLANKRLVLKVEELAALVQEEEEKDRRLDVREIVAVLRALRNHGYVELLEDTAARRHVLLAPDVMIGLASSIILEARRNPRGLGALNEEQLLQGGYPLQEVTDLQPDERNILLDSVVLLFIERNVCFRESVGLETYLVFPALISQGRPLRAQSPRHDDVTYRVSGAVENVFAALVVLLGYTNTFRRTQQWRDHAEYELSTGQVCGFRQSFSGDGEMELVIFYGQGAHESTKMLFQGLFEDILRRRSVQIERYVKVACPSCQSAQERSTVIRRLHAGKDFMICEECGERISLQEPEPVGLQAVRTQAIIDSETLTARGRTTYQSALVRIKALARDRGLAQPNCFISYAWEHESVKRWVEKLAGDLTDAGVDVTLDVWDNAAPGGSIPRFISQIEDAGFVLVVGTPGYRMNYFKEGEGEESIVAAEMELIGARLMGSRAEKNSVIPVLYQGEPAMAFPPQLRGKVYADFSAGADYFAALLDLVLKLYELPPRDPDVASARAILSVPALGDLEELRPGMQKPPKPRSARNS